MRVEKVLSRNFNNPEMRHLKTYLAQGGYDALKKAIKMEPTKIVEVVKNSGLRGRGGAGFPTGLKWTFIPKQTQKPIYLCVNADEGEPGTFKDREILTWDPHLLIEGIAISSFALGCHTSYIYVRGEFSKEIRILQEALDQAYQEGFLGKSILGSGYRLDVFIHKGAGAYICGEETALLECF